MNLGREGVVIAVGAVVALLLQIVVAPNIALFSAQPIKAYAVQCKRVGEVYEQTQYTTAESIVVDARPYAPGPMVCRAAAVSSMEVCG